MIRMIALLIFTAFLVAALSLSEHRPPNANLPMVNALAVEFPKTGAQVAMASPLWPPSAYQGPNAALVIFAGADAVQSLCAGSASLKQGQMFLGCMGAKDGMPIIVVPNPCLMPETDFYAGIVCHELGHENGWRHG